MSDYVAHSRGTDTVFNAFKSIANDEENLPKGNRTYYPIEQVGFFGGAANAQKSANVLKYLTKGKGTMLQSTNPYDGVGRIIGGNPSTCDSCKYPGLLEAHINYTGHPSPGMEKIWGAEGYSRLKVVLPTNRRNGEQ